MAELLIDFEATLSRLAASRNIGEVGIHLFYARLRALYVTLSLRGAATTCTGLTMRTSPVFRPFFNECGGRVARDN